MYSVLQYLTHTVAVMTRTNQGLNSGSICPWYPWASHLNFAQPMFTHFKMK